MTATLYATSHLASRSRVYPVLGRVKWGWAFAPCVIPPNQSGTGCTRVLWKSFHSLVPIHEDAKAKELHKAAQQQQQGQGRREWGGWGVNAYGKDKEQQQQQQGQRAGHGVGEGHGQQQQQQQQRWQQQGEQGVVVASSSGGDMGGEEVPKVWWQHTMGRVAEVQESVTAAWMHPELRVSTSKNTKS